jgi:hypothetical protein
MPKETLQSNCIGFVFSELNIIPEDKYVKPPTLAEVLETFDIVDTLDQAKILMVVDFSQNDPRIDHIAIVCENKIDIIHRKGIGAQVIRENIRSGLKNYLEDSRDEKLIFYFNTKPSKED